MLNATEVDNNDVLKWFVRFLCFKIGWHYFLIYSIELQPLPAVLAMVAIILPWLPRGIPTGVMLLFIFHAMAAVYSFPFTINHHFFELFLLVLVLILYRCNKDEEASNELPDLILSFIRFSFLWVVFFAGVQKLVHGYYLNGEIFKIYLAQPNDGLGLAVDRLLRLSGLSAGTTPRDILPETSLDAQLPTQARQLFRFLGVAVVFGEIAVPVLVWLKPRIGRWLLLALTVSVAAVPQEFSFAVTALACVFTYFQVGYGALYWVLAMCHILAALV